MTHKDYSTDSRNHNGVSPEVAARLAGLGAAPPEAAGDAAVDPRGLLTVMKRSEILASNHPWVAAGAMFGIGAILGALVHRLVAHRSTVTELLGIDALPSKARRAVTRYF